eukprot:gnl/MRDRNA2_/MRDRNA2_89788_c0_seq1.p1 gnl/MRDRNA2_/MRDRNA2_89788_c0~~gnl/MRDRNA2_/MRDRNA2_89788_c0_seq1.p1  ORF type:complete len:1450 (+),score=368.34 gnl/MRDRNA2_/MRDRNA2_89788_c0_seq1:99-4448(+)
MEVTLVDFQGIPAEALVSIRAGNERRQAPAKPNHPFKFPSAPKDSNPFRIDVYSPLGSRLVSLDTTQTRHMVDIGGMMSMTLDIKGPDATSQTQAQGAKIPVPAISGMKAKLGQASEFNTYLERHNMISFIQDLFMDLLHRRPDSPYDYLMEKLHGAGVQQSVMKEREESDMRIHELLDIMQDDKAEIKRQFGRASLSPDLPSYLSEMFASEDFERLCNDRFSMLDVDDNGVLTAEELFPIIVELSAEQAHSVTFEHCVRFLKIFDEAKNGCLSQKEFFEFSKFVHLMQWLDDQLLQSPHGQQDLTVIGSAGFPQKETAPGEVVSMEELNEDAVAIDDMLNIMHGSVITLKKQLGKLSSSPHLPDWLRETLTDDSFVLQCNSQFDDLDKDSNGTLSPDELFPLIIQLSSSNPLAVTNEHCLRLTAIFDEDKNGVISRSEFVELTRFIFLIMWLENQDQGQQQEMTQPISHVTVEEMLDMMAAGVSAVKTHMGKIINCPDLPEWLHNTLVSEEFVLAVQSEFDVLDVDGNGTLCPEELYPVIIQLSEDRPVTVLPEHCSYLTAIFDEDNNGVISRGEFVELVRFIFVVQWLKDQDRLEAVLRLHDVLSMMEQDVRYVKNHIDDIMASPDVGAWLRELFMSEDFPLECKKFYDQLDADGNGVLSRDELVPVLVQLTGEHPITITQEHCQQLLEIFDEDNNGVISRSEFINIAQFVFVMQWLEDQKQVALADQGAFEYEAEMAASEYRIAQIIAMFQSDKAELKKQFGDISKCPDLPEWFRHELTSPEFVNQCAEKFTALDIDQNGSLSLDELYPVIEEMTDEHPVAITLAHCQQLMEAVDSNKNGTISKDEFKEFIQFVCLVKWLEGLAAEEEAAIAAEGMDTFQELETLDKELETLNQELEAWAIDTILDRWRANRADIKQQLGNIAKSTDLPDWLRDVFNDPGFITECEAQFDALDTNKNGSLQPEEVFPLVVELVAGRPVAVSSDHCMKFIEIFDDDNSGGLDRSEFADFMRFVCLMQWLEAEDAARRQQQQVEEDELRVHQLLDMIEVDAAAVKKNFSRASCCPDIPDWMKEQFAQEEFTSACNEKYDALDQDGNGMLSPDELYPVILELSGGHPMSVTIDHCRRLLKMFDEDKKGVLSRTEFADFVKFIWLQLWLEQQRLQQMMDLDSLEAEWRITNLLDMWHHNMIGLKGKWGTVCNSPDVPAWLKETLQDSSMTEMCHKQFDDLDADGNGVLTANELLPVIVELCQEHPLDITQEHCQMLLDIFDEDKSGTIERGEFLEFVRFIVVVSWLQEQAGNIAPPQTPSLRSFGESDAFDIEDRVDPLQSLGQAPPPSIGQSPEKVFEGELKATQEALMATQNQLKAVQLQLQATTGQVAQALSGADMSPPNDSERLLWQKEKEKLLQDLAAAKSLAEMQKKGMAETVGKLMTEKMELESQLTMAKAGK